MVRWLVSSLILLVVLALVVPLALLRGLEGRAERLDVVLPRSEGRERTLLLVGVDDRSLAPEGSADFGEPGSDPGARADLVLALRTGPDGVRAASIPRDLLVEYEPQHYDRLATTWLQGPQALLDGLCRTLDLAVDHVVVVNLRGFTSLVDEVGGVEVDVPRPIRDPWAHIELPAGQQVLDGRSALGYVRSRQGEVLQDGGWIPDPEGAGGRQRRAGEVLRALLHRLPRNPVRLHSIAWNLMPEVSLDPGTGLLDLLAFRDVPADIVTVPTEGGTNPEDWVAWDGPATHESLRELGLATGCSA